MNIDPARLQLMIASHATKNSALHRRLASSLPGQALRRNSHARSTAASREPDQYHTPYMHRTYLPHGHLDTRHAQTYLYLTTANKTRHDKSSIVGLNTALLWSRTTRFQDCVGV